MKVQLNVPAFVTSLEELKKIEDEIARAKKEFSSPKVGDYLCWSLSRLWLVTRISTTNRIEAICVYDNVNDGLNRLGHTDTFITATDTAMQIVQPTVSWHRTPSR